MSKSRFTYRSKIYHTFGHVLQIAKALIGNRSGVVIKTPKGDIKKRILPVGRITIFNENKSITAGLTAGSEKMMKAVEQMDTIDDVEGERGTNVGGMLANMRKQMAVITGQPKEEIKNCKNQHKKSTSIYAYKVL